jgi:hypothetical protein
MTKKLFWCKTEQWKSRRIGGHTITYLSGKSITEFLQAQPRQVRQL